MIKPWRETTEHEFDHLVGAQSEFVLVYFYANWCDASNQQEVVLRSLPSVENRDISLLRINVDKAHDLARRQGIQSVPSLVLYDGGKAIHSRTGFASDTDLLVMFAKMLYRIDTNAHYHFDSSPHCRITESGSQAKTVSV